MSTTRDRLEDLARDLDMVVFRLERDPGSADALERLTRERRRVRRELESLRDRLEDLVRSM